MRKCAMSDVSRLAIPTVHLTPHLESTRLVRGMDICASTVGTIRDGSHGKAGHPESGKKRISASYFAPISGMDSSQLAWWCSPTHRCRSRRSSDVLYEIGSSEKIE